LPSTLNACAGNRLLEGLPRNDQRRFRGRCESVELAFAELVYSPGRPIVHVYFPTRSSISLILPATASVSIEVGMVGNEGMFGTQLALGVADSPLRAVVQGPGAALRMRAADFCGELGRSPALSERVGRYISVQMSQLARRATCIRFHVVEARLARWLLMTGDRAHSEHFHTTHESLASMLGVRRVGVTNAATALQKRGLIRYTRGNITVLDRRSLRSASCGCYGADLESYKRMLG
jgi:CRP-like cAMP-binding protein